MKTLKASNGRTNTPIDRTINLPAMKINTLVVTLIGQSPLCVLRFSEKAKNMMLAKQMGEAASGKEPKDPLQLFKDSYYADKDGFLFPSICFKAACVASANDIEFKQTEMRRAFHICGEFVRIDAPPITEMSEWDSKYAKELKWEHERGCSMRCDPVRNASGVADLRFRSFFKTWRVTLRTDYNAAMITEEQLLMLLTVAGFGNGVGEWRPGSKMSKTGTWGRWKLEQGE